MPKNNAVICLLCGLPGAGKTTLARQLRNQISETFDFTLYHYDDLIEWNSDLNLVSWKDRRAEVLRKCRNDIQNSFNMQTELGHVFLVDDNMYLQSMRYSYFQLARSFTVGFCQIYIECSEPLLKQRVKKRNESQEFGLKISDGTFERLLKSFEPPKLEVNEWEANTVTVSPNIEIETIMRMTENLFNHAIKSPVQPLPVLEKIVCGVDSFHHQADLLLRNLIKAKIEKSEPKARGIIARSLSENKKLLLELFRVKSVADLYTCENLRFLNKECNDKVLSALEILDWPLDKWEPADVCEQVITECFETLAKLNQT